MSVDLSFLSLQKPTFFEPKPFVHEHYFVNMAVTDYGYNYYYEKTDTEFTYFH